MGRLSSLQSLIKCNFSLLDDIGFNGAMSLLKTDPTSSKAGANRQGRVLRMGELGLRELRSLKLDLSSS